MTTLVLPAARRVAAAVSPERIGLALLLALGAAVIWLPHRPPIIDLPQHAAQIALLRDLAMGRSPWASEVRVNLFTPYLLGYGLAFPLSMVMPVAAAIKVVLTVAYAAFGAVCIGIRRELGAARELDAYYFVSFFGFAYSWGFYTFLVSAPVGLAFIWLAIRYARQGGAIRGLWLAVLGVVLLFCHGLVFLFAAAVGLGVLRETAKGLRDAIARSWPFAIPLMMCAVLFVVTAGRETPTNSASTSMFYLDMGTFPERLIDFLWGSFESQGDLRWLPILVVFAALPFCGGLRFDVRRVESLVIAVGVLAVMLLVPSYAWLTAFLFQRFALFLLPAYAWLFSPAPSPRPGVARLIAPYVSVIALAAASFSLLAHLAQAASFSREARDFDAVEAHAAPNQRALSVMRDPRSAANDNPLAYLNFPQWYQAEKRGFVDPSFAQSHTVVVTFRGLMAPVYTDNVFMRTEGMVGTLDWRRDQLWRYRYFFVRSTTPLPKAFFVGVDCPPVSVATSGPWELLERRPCIDHRLLGS